MSSEIKTEIKMTNSKAIATATLALSTEDFDILGRVGPLVVEFGGTFDNNGTDVTIPANEQSITSQIIKVSHTFSTEDVPADNEEQAISWLSAISTRCSTALSELRVLDGNLVGPDASYTTI